MKIYAVKNGHFSRKTPTANVPLFGQLGPGIGIADNGWVIRKFAARTNRSGNSTPFNWDLVPADCDRIAFCTGKDSSGKWDWSFLVKDESHLTPEEAKRWNDRWNELTRKGRELCTNGRAIIDRINALNETERKRFERITDSKGFRAYSYSNPLKFMLDEAMREGHNEIAHRAEHHIKSLEFLFSRFEKYSPSAEERAAKAPNGKMTVHGEILSMKWNAGRFGGAMKMLVKLDNHSKVFGTMPQPLQDCQPNRGDEIEFTATFTRSNDDPSFGFFTRPQVKKINRKPLAKPKKELPSTSKETAKLLNEDGMLY